MTTAPEDREWPFRGVGHALAGISLLLIGALCWDNGALYVGVVFVAAGFYGVVTGAVARGIELSRPPGSGG